jgi:hypothetical protein
LLGAAAGRIRHQISISPSLVTLTVVLVGLSLYCVIPLPEWLLRLSLLSQVHEARALLGIGIASILLVCLFLDRYREPVFGKRWTLAGALGATLAIGSVFYVVHARAPALFEDRIHLAVLIFVNVLVVGMFLWDRGRKWLPPAFAFLLICSNALINPVMQGLGPLTESAAFREVERINAADPGSKWIAYEDYATAQLLKAAGARVFNGTKVVPDLPFLRELDSERTSEAVFNRYARIVCALQVLPEKVSFSLVQNDVYIVNLPPGLPILRSSGYDYYVFPAKWDDALFYDFSLIATTPSNTTWIYRRIR